MISWTLLFLARVLANPCAPLTNYLSSIEIERAISMMPDPTCSSIPPSYGCLDAQCRKCKIYDTMFSKQYAQCPLNLLPPIYSSDNITCTSFLYPSEPNAGVSAIYDATCTLSGEYGCMPNYLPCRRCSKGIENVKNYIPCDLDQVICLNSSGIVNVNGINDPSCISFPSLPGCNGTSCRLCRHKKHVTNAHLPDCTTLYALTRMNSEVLVLSKESGQTMNTFVSTLTDSAQRIAKEIGIQLLLMNTISSAVFYGLIITGSIIVCAIGICLYYKCKRPKITIPSKPILLDNNQLVIAV
ncbi:hypothetical protein THRCLA_23465 [Thraustotheca clavata]|uniref:Uncharacterized protein n=1 Tax=Thraustotheca clavata TaxID=74557 RepID=A0A1V9Y4A4_9STRA|nr:hypothetical protein THRCLA_23465 [Thraustotheca clavata]